MPSIYLLDSGPLGLLAHDRPVRRAPIQNWLMQETTGGATVYISEVADYEVRREITLMIRTGKLPASRLARLERLANLFTYLPVSTAIGKRAAEFWAGLDSREFRPPGQASDVLMPPGTEVGATVVTSNAGTSTAGAGVSVAAHHG